MPSQSRVKSESFVTAKRSPVSANRHLERRTDNSQSSGPDRKAGRQITRETDIAAAVWVILEMIYKSRYILFCSTSCFRSHIKQHLKGQQTSITVCLSTSADVNTYPYSINPLSYPFSIQGTDISARSILSQRSKRESNVYVCLVFIQGRGGGCIQSLL